MLSIETISYSALLFVQTSQGLLHDTGRDTPMQRRSDPVIFPLSLEPK